MLEVYIDGGCEPNPGGTAAYGVLVQKVGGSPGLGHPQEVVWRIGQVVGSGPSFSNNVAEYEGLLAFLNWYEGSSHCMEAVVIRSDSQMLVNQINGNWRIKGGLYADRARRAKVLVDQLWPSPKIGKFKICWIPREENLADSIATRSLGEAGVVRRN